MRDRKGNTIPGLEQQKRRWAEHFEDPLNRPSPSNPANIQPANCDLPIDCDVPSKEEMYKAIEQLRNAKSAGPDTIPAQALKVDEVTTVEMLYPLFQNIWKEEDISTESGRRATSSSSQRRVTLVPAPTTGG